MEFKGRIGRTVAESVAGWPDMLDCNPRDEKAAQTLQTQVDMVKQ